MRARFYLLIGNLRTGFWFLPSLMLLMAAGAAVLLLWADRSFDPGIHASIAWAYSGGPEGARSLLTTIAGSMITAATVTFSLASVALSIASQQYGSRVLRNFMRDRITQILLGTFISTFIYSVLVVPSIRGTTESGGFVPAMSVTAAIVFSLVSLILLIFFVHHISTSIKASHILRVINADLCGALPHLFPLTGGEAYQGEVQRQEMERRGKVEITAKKSGYLQSLDMRSMVDLARRKSAVVELRVMPGDHIIAEEPIATVWGVERLDEGDERGIRRALVMGGERTAAQDIRYQFQQLTEVVIRALSPGINDPFTAITGVDQLAESLAQFARHPRAAVARQDNEGRLRVIVPVPEVDEILDSTVGHIAAYASRDRFVMSGLRRILDLVEGDLAGEKERGTLYRLRHELDQSSA
jgi:uncharacterized membrane protein